MLLVSLIVLVALTMAGIAMMRSVDTSTIVAGNIGFRQSSVNAADQGVQAAYAYVLANISTLAANAGNDPANGYTGITPPGERPDWYTNPNDAGWANAVSCNGPSVATACASFGPGGTATDVTGNNVTYVIHRLCDASGVCGQTQSSSAISGEGVDQSAPNFFTTTPSIHFRVTVRSIGGAAGRTSVAYVQMLLRGQ